MKTTIALLLTLSASFTFASESRIYKLDTTQGDDVLLQADVCGYPVEVNVPDTKKIGREVVVQLYSAYAEQTQIQNESNTDVIIAKLDFESEAYKFGLYEKVTVVKSDDQTFPESFSVETTPLNYLESAEVAEGACGPLSYKLQK